MRAGVRGRARHKVPDTPFRPQVPHLRSGDPHRIRRLARRRYNLRRNRMGMNIGTRERHTRGKTEHHDR